MNATTVAFFNNKGGVGKTSLVYHLAWMYADLDLRVLAADFDPQANLSAAFLDEDRLSELWLEDQSDATVYDWVRPLLRGVGDVSEPRIEPIEDNLGLLVGDLALSGFEDELSNQWPQCMDGKERAFRVISAFWRIIRMAATDYDADVVLMDLGPNLGAINRATLIAADKVVIPLSPDLFSLQGLQNLGPTFRRWRGQWKDRLDKNPEPNLALPHGEMQPIGYIVMQHSTRLDRPVKAYQRWIARIPAMYRKAVLDESSATVPEMADDPHCLAMLKHYRSLMPLSQEARKPIFFLKPADGAIGAHTKAVRSAYHDFQKLAREIAQRTDVELRALLGSDS